MSTPSRRNRSFTSGPVQWRSQSVRPDVPLHFSRFYPQYFLKNLPPTSLEALERAKAIADSEGLHHAYIGNVPGHPAKSTYCPRCRSVVVEREGYVVKAIQLQKGKCRNCQQAIPGLWES